MTRIPPFRFTLPFTLLATLASPSSSSPQEFENVAAAAGLSAYLGSTGDPHGPGVACGDYDNDGWADLYFVGGWGHPGHLYRNTSNGSGRVFVRDIAAGIFEFLPSTGAVFVDIDNDGDQDLYVSNYTERNTLYENRLVPDGAASFVDITDSTDPTPTDPPGDLQEGVGFGVDANGDILNYTFVASFGDVNRDGLVDLFVGNHKAFYNNPFGIDPGQRDVLYLQQADGTFLDVTSEAGTPGWLSPLGDSQTAYHDYASSNAAMFADLNNDRWPDLYVSNKTGSAIDHDSIYMNRGVDPSGHWLGFEERATDLRIGDKTPGAMGIDAGDYDADGDLDIYMTDLGSETGALNDLWVNELNERNGDFHMHHDGHVGATYSWGTWMGDVDNDGDVDIHVATNVGMSDRLYRNDNARMVDVSATAGIDQANDSRGDVWLDYDQDGWLDFVVVNLFIPPSLFRNKTGDSASGNYLILELTGNYTEATPRRSTRDAVGTRVLARGDFDGDGDVDATELSLRELARGGSNCASSDEGMLHFGLGAATEVDLEILWPSGRRQELLGVAANQRMFVTEPSTIPDATVPTVALLEPLPGAILASPGTVEVHVQASDDTAITDVRVFVDDVFVGRELQPQSGDLYVHALRLDDFTNGPHTLKVFATDARANVTEATTGFVIDTSVPAVLGLEVDRYDDLAVGVVPGENFPVGLVFDDEWRDFTLSYGGSVQQRSYYVAHDAEGLFVDGSRLEVRGEIRQITDPENFLGFGAVLMRAPGLSDDDRIELWLRANIQDDIPFLLVGANLPGGPPGLSPVAWLDSDELMQEFELSLTRKGDRLSMEIQRVGIGTRLVIGEFDAAAAGIDLDEYDRAGFLVGGYAANPAGVSDRFGLTQVRVTHPAFGTACPDSDGYVAELGLMDQPLRGNDAFGFSLRGARPGTLAVLMVGLSDQVLNGNPVLPLSLNPFGAPGCTLYVSGEFGFFNMTSMPAGMQAGSGTVGVPVNVPDNPALVGRSFYAQWAVVDILASSLGIVYSAAIEVQVQ